MSLTFCRGFCLSSGRYPMLTIGKAPDSTVNTMLDFTAPEPTALYTVRPMMYVPASSSPIPSGGGPIVHEHDVTAGIVTEHGGGVGGAIAGILHPTLNTLVHKMPLLSIFEVQHWLLPPGLSPQPEPPHVPHEDAQQTSPSAIPWLHQLCCSCVHVQLKRRLGPPTFALGSSGSNDISQADKYVISELPTARSPPSMLPWRGSSTKATRV